MPLISHTIRFIGCDLIEDIEFDLIECECKVMSIEMSFGNNHENCGVFTTHLILMEYFPTSQDCIILCILIDQTLNYVIL